MSFQTASGLWMVLLVGCRPPSHHISTPPVPVLMNAPPPAAARQAFVEAHVLLAQGEHERALEAFERAAQHDPRAPAILRGMAVVAERNGDLARRDDLLLQAAEIEGR